MNEKNDIFDISVEISAVSAIISGLSNQFEDGGTRLNDDFMNLALLGVSRHLDRISEDLEAM